MKILVWKTTPLGPLWAGLDAQGRLTTLHWGDAPTSAETSPNHPLQHLLEAYFSGRTTLTSGIAGHLNLSGTPFQQRVWQALLQIPQGQTVTYGQLAATLGTHPRALGGAVGANPVAILVPCHRVVGSSGKLTGFSAPGGITTKKWLLNHEGVAC